MLQKIRKTAEGVIFRIFLGIIVLAFAIWGASDIAKGKSNREIVTFKNVSPITYEDFAIAKAKEIKNIQRSEGVTFSEEQIAKMNIDNEIMGILVRKKLLSSLISRYDLDFSDAVIADVIKTFPLFHDENKTFSIERFKSYLHMNNLTTTEYSEEVKDYIARSIILGSFVGNSYVASARISNIVDFMSEKRTIDIASISLTDNKRVEAFNISDETLVNFYNENKDMFKTQEMRDICYSKIDYNIGKSHILVTDQEVKQFYDENKSEFANNKFEKVKADIKQKLEKHKTDIWVSEISKSLEDEVAGGSTLSEIVDKYKLKRICEKNLNAQNIDSKAGGIFASFISHIYEMAENEVSYPLENKDDGVILFEVTKHVREAPLEFAAVKQDVVAKYKLFAYRQESLKRIQDCASSADAASFNKTAGEFGLNIQTGKSFERSDLANIKTFPAEMLVAIFSSDKGMVVGPFVSEDSAYIFVVRNIISDKDAKRKMETSKDNIIEKIREGLMEELLFYERVQNGVAVKFDPKALDVRSE